MSRPTKEELGERDTLEDASARLDSAGDLCGILAVRLRQMYRRHPSLYDRFVEANEQLTELSDDVDAASEAIRDILAARQEKRSKATEAKE
jgi:hypothetical protein